MKIDPKFVLLCALLASRSSAWGVDGLEFAPSARPTTAPALSPAPAPVNLQSLQNVTIMNVTSPGASRPIGLYPMSAPPISGFIPRLAFTLTTEHDSDIYSIPSNTPGGNPLPGPSPVYRIATLDSGAQTHIISVADYAAFNIDGAGLGGIYTTTATGANGTETVSVTDAMGIYATGFGNITSTNGILGVATSSFQGQYNVSMTAAMGNSALPSVIGAPMLGSYRAVIRNSVPRHLQMGTETFRTPDVQFEALSASLPTGYSKLGLTKVPAPFLGFEFFSTPAQYTPDFLEGTNHPYGPTGWYSLMAGVNATHSAGSFNNQSFLFDTGAQVTVISEGLAAQLGYYTGAENPSTPDFTVQISGVGGEGTVDVPGFYVNQLSIPMLNGPALTWSHVPVIVMNLPDPAGINDNVAGIIGMNLFTDRDLVLNGIYPAQSGGTNSFVGVSPQWQWNLTTGGSWNNSANWTLALPNGMDTQANFYSRITAAQTITVNSAVTVGAMNFDNLNKYTIAGPGTITLQVSADQAEINVAAGSHTISAPVVFTGPTALTVWPSASRLQITNGINAAGKLITTGGKGIVETKNIQAGTLVVSDGTLQITPNGTAAGLSRVSFLQVGGSSLNFAHLDLTNNSMIVDPTGTLNFTAVRNSVAGGYANGLWNGEGILSSMADQYVHAVGVADNNVLHLSGINGVTLQPGSILLKYTYFGDANLDGMVTAKDLAMLSSHWQNVSNAWTSGDFNYDGRVDIRDLYLIAINWQKGVGAPLAESFGEALASLGLPINVPEPASAGIAVIALLTFTTSRRLRKANQSL